ncbi:MAG: phosphatidate cytidylyltransferase [Clostridia bacterium]|nr:phosphatidate cytidylyltransferase [Clostridia bacterium]
MLKRVITGVVAILILLPVLIFSDTVLFPIAISLVSLVSLYELFQCTQMKKCVAVILPLYIFALVAPFLMRYLADGESFALIAFISAAVYVIYLFALVVWSHGKLPFSDAAAVFAMSLYVIAAMSAITYIRDFPFGGEYIYLLIFLGAWVTDTFAYFTGFLFGKHKLIPDVSPKKTVEGSIGGIVFCSLSFVAFGLIVDHFFGQDANLGFLLVSGVIISLISQIGDLIMSVIKRHYGIKDFGKLFPGHGGMLDRFDSILAVSLGLCAICMFATLSGISLI